MVRAATGLLLLLMAAMSVPARCQDGSEWDRTRYQLMASQHGTMAQAIERWRMLSSSDRFSFSDYAGFLLTYPGFPDEGKIKIFAEKALEREPVDSSRLIAYFDRIKPLTNPAKARYAAALTAARRPEASAASVEAWRGGEMSDASAAALLAYHGREFTPADHDARMNALLWAGETAQAQQQIAYASPGARSAFMARLALLQDMSPDSLGIALTPDLLRDPGYIYNRVHQLRQSGNYPEVTRLLSTRPPAATPPLDPAKWIAELLNSAKGADAASAVRIAASVDDTFAPGTDVSRLAYKLRDDYTSLMWLRGSRALRSLGDADRAAPLFYRYGAAARTAQTRAKGFYWAGRALAQHGQSSGGARYFEMAAAYPDQFYGMLALERLGRPLPDLNTAPTGSVTAAARAAFEARPLTAAVREVARNFDWPTSVRFFREISDQAQTPADHLLVADLARSIGRRDLAVILGQSLNADSLGDVRSVAFPLIPVPPGSDWTLVHAITRQESQFAMGAVSHSGARGLMQLMPGTARETAGKLGLSYDSQALLSDASYNIRLGDAVFARMMDTYGGSYPLAVAAYNAGPGNVNRWLAANGDPRYSGIDWIQWIENIPLQETRNYVQRVLENAVVYEAMNPAHARYHGAAPLSHFLGKRTPG